VRRVAQKHLHPEASCVAASGPLKKRDLERAFAQAVSA